MNRILTETIRRIQNNQRRGVAKVKTRAEVSGGGRKPWKQKGTGNARVGSTRSPLWRGGGKAFGPTNDIGQLRQNQKESRSLIKQIFTEKSQNKIILTREEFPKSAKTKLAIKYLTDKAINDKTGIIFLIDQEERVLNLVFRNLANVKVSLVNQINVLDLLKSDQILITENAWKLAEKYWLSSNS